MNKTYIIAEACSNHNGSMKLAKELIDVAADAGADAVKFQTFRADKLMTSAAFTKEQIAEAKSMELSFDQHVELIDYCKTKKIAFLSTPFDSESIEILQKLKLPQIKIPSGEITTAPFLLEIAKYGKPVILSTGMSTLGEIENALGILAFGFLGISEKPTTAGFSQAFSSHEGQELLNKNVTILQCTTSYPAALADINLGAMKTIRDAFGLPVGFSDHTLSIAVPAAAVALGACMIEKHFTMSRDLAGWDHKASMEPGELKAMIRGIREVELALGTSRKAPMPAELPIKKGARKSLVAASSIKKGEAFTTENLTAKRPGSGISSLYYFDYVGRVAQKDYATDEVIV